MIGQSRELEPLIKNHKAQVDLLNRLKGLLEDVNSIDFDLQRILADSRKFVSKLNSSRKDEYDDLLKKIQRLAKKINDDIDEQSIRLDNFEGKIKDA